MQGGGGGGGDVLPRIGILKHSPKTVQCVNSLQPVEDDTPSLPPHDADQTGTEEDTQNGGNSGEETNASAVQPTTN